MTANQGAWVMLPLRVATIAVVVFVLAVVGCEGKPGDAAGGGNSGPGRGGEIETEAGKKLQDLGRQIGELLEEQTQVISEEFATQHAKLEEHFGAISELRSKLEEIGKSLGELAKEAEVLKEKQAREVAELGKALEETRALVGKTAEELEQLKGHPLLQRARSAAAGRGAITVYVTRTGKKYHRAGCQYLRQSAIPMALTKARAGYTPCSVCGPPR